MDEQLLVERLGAVGDATPPPDLGDRIRAEVGRRSRRRRARAAVVFSVVAVLAVGGLVALTRGGGRPQPAGPFGGPTGGSTASPTDGPTSTPGPTRQARATTLAKLFPGRTARRVDRRLANGQPFRAIVLAPDGTLVGAEQTYDQGWTDHWGRSLILDPIRRTEVVLPLREITGYASGGRLTTWLDNVTPKHKYDLFCRDAVTGAISRVSDGSVWEDSVQIDQGHLAWSYYEDFEPRHPQGQVVLAEGCHGPQRVLPVLGGVTALRWPKVYVRQYEQGRLLRHDVLTGRTETVLGDLPTYPAGPWEATVSRSTVLWLEFDVDEQVTLRQLRAVDLRTGRDVLVAAEPPHIPGYNGASFQLTAGNRLLAYASSPMDGPPYDSRGIVYDPVTGSAVWMPGETFVAGDWLVWLEDDAYWLLDVS